MSTDTTAVTGWSFHSDRVETSAPVEPFTTAEVAQTAAIDDYLARNPMPECNCAHGCLRWRPELLDEPRRYWLERHARFTGHTVFTVEEPLQTETQQNDAADEALRQAHWQQGRKDRERCRTFVNGDGEEI